MTTTERRLVVAMARLVLEIADRSYGRNTTEEIGLARSVEEAITDVENEDGEEVLPQSKSRVVQLADAIIKVVEVDHYMVGLNPSEPHSIDELEAAEQVLISRQNRYTRDAPEHAVLERALDWLNADLKR